MDKAGEIEGMIAGSLQAMGYGIVRVQLGRGKRVTLQIMAERLDEQPMSADDCAEISRAVSAILDVEDPIADAYTLEVSSPGIDRPLTRPADFQRFAGQEARIETRLPLDGRKRFQGRLLGLEDGLVRLALSDGGELKLPLDDVAKAKLVLTEALLAEAMRRQERDGAETPAETTPRTTH